MMRNFLTIIVCCFFTLGVKSQVPQGFFLDDWTPKLISIPSFTPTAATTATPTITVTADVNSVLNKVAKSMYGHNAHTWGGQYNTNTTFTNNVKNLVAGVIRYPGGSLSDNYYWNASGNSTMPSDLPSDYNYNDLHWGGTKAGWSLSLNNYYDLLAKTNTTGIITVNYAYARVGTSANPVAKAAHLAADWVRYDNGRTRYWEIGNEEYGAWEYGFTIDPALNKDNQPTKNTGLNYGKHCSIFIDSMRVAAAQVGNDIKIGVVCFADNPDSQWNIGLLPQVATKADYLIAHNYYTPKGSQPVAVILDAADNTQNPKNYLIADLVKYGKVSTLPVALTEWNSRDTIGNQKYSVINGVFATIVLGEAIKNGFGLSNRWAFMNDKHSLIGGSNTPGMSAYSPYPSFFYMYYFQKMFGDKIVNTTIAGISGAKTDSIRAWSSTFSSGQVGVVLLNKGVNQRTISVKVLNYLKGKKYYYYVLSGENGITYSQRVVINGQTTTDAFGGPTNYATLQPYGTDIVNGTINITLPKYGVVFLVVENGNTANDNVVINNGLKLDISPNPSSDNLNIDFTGFESPEITISDMLGKINFQSKVLTTNHISINPLSVLKNKGLYLVTISAKNGSQTKKVVVQ